MKVPLTPVGRDRTKRTDSLVHPFLPLQIHPRQMFSFVQMLTPLNVLFIFSFFSLWASLRSLGTLLDMQWKRREDERKATLVDLSYVCLVYLRGHAPNTFFFFFFHPQHTNKPWQKSYRCGHKASFMSSALEKHRKGCVPLELTLLDHVFCFREQMLSRCRKLETERKERIREWART